MQQITLEAAPSSPGSTAMVGLRNGSVWPTGVDYATAVQCGGVDGDRLDRPTFLEGILGSPWSAHGRHAIVFKAKGASGGFRALRCFTTAGPCARLRQEAISRHLARHPVPAMVTPRWVDRGIRVEDREWPVLDMEWIEGRRLDRWFDDEIGAAPDPAVGPRLSRLADTWRRTILDLVSARVAHGDLQHGNVLVTPGDGIRLVDLDGVWLPELGDRPSAECGHEAYQHPDRAQGGQWDDTIDGFSALLIWVSLRLLAAEPSLWDLHHPGDDHLLLTEQDLADPARGVWDRLDEAADPETRPLLQRLHTAVQAPLDRVGSPLVTLAQA